MILGLLALLTVLVTGALLVSVAVLRSCRSEQVKVVGGPLPICGCGHPLAFHQRTGDRTCQQVARPSFGPDICPCAGYIGPEVITMPMITLEG